MEKIGKLFGVFLILICLCIGYMLHSAGAFRSIQTHFQGTVEILNSPPGIEDITIDQETGQVYLSSHDRRNPENPGKLLTFNLSDSTVYFNNLNVARFESEFRPHGISLLKKYGRTFIFAISHENSGHFVHRFELADKEIIGHKKFTGDLFISPNDLVAIDSSTFYFTNDHGMKKGMERTVKDYLLDKNGFVVLYHEGSARQVSQLMAYANGINVSPDGNFLYVTSTTESTLFVYKNDINAPVLKMLDKLKISSGLDNIEIDKEGNLYIGAHPKMLRFLAHAKEESDRSPSQIIKIIYLPETDYKFLQEELYLNNGDPLSGSSVASFYTHSKQDNDLLLGSVFESKILRLHRTY